MTTEADIETDVRLAFRAALASVPGLPAVAFQGVEYEPAVGTAFVIETMRPVGETLRGIGAAPVTQHQIAMSWTLHFPSGRGTRDIETMTGAIASRFQPGTHLVRGATRALVQARLRSPLLEAPDWISRTLTVTVVAYSNT